MTLTVDHATRVVTVPQADLSFISAGLYELDTETFRNLLRDLEDDPANMALPYILLRIVPYTISGTTYAQALFITNGFSIEFEDGQYTILLKNSNNNFSDVQDGILVRNQVQVIPSNSAGLQIVSSGDPDDIASSVWEAADTGHADGTMGDALVQIDALAISYGGEIHIDTKNGVAGDQVGTNGTVSNPVSNIVDARTIADALNLRCFRLRGEVTLDDSYDDWEFQGVGAETAVELAGQDVQDTEFVNMLLSGDAASSTIKAENCVIDGVTNVTGILHECPIKGTLSLSPGLTTFSQCISDVPGNTSPIIDAQGAGRTFNLRAYSGGVEIRGMSDVTNIGTIELIAGKITVASSCTAGALSVRGIGVLTDSSAGTTIDDDSLMSKVTIAEEGKATEIRQAWTRAITGGSKMLASVHLLVGGESVVLSPTATLDVTVFDSTGSAVISQTGILAGAKGFFSLEENPFTPTAGGNLASFATITDGSTVYGPSITPLSFPEFS
jgi:hypothetical protein